MGHAATTWLNGLQTEPAVFDTPVGRFASQRAALKAQMLAVERRIAISLAPWTDDLVSMAALGAALCEAGPRGGRWVQRSRASLMAATLEAHIRTAGECRPQDFIKFVLATAAASRGLPRPSRDTLFLDYERLTREVDADAAPSAERLIAFAKAGALWAQAGPSLSAFHLREELQSTRLRVQALRSPMVDDFIRLAVLEVAMQAVEHPEPMDD